MCMSEVGGSSTGKSFPLRGGSDFLYWGSSELKWGQVTSSKFMGALVSLTEFDWVQVSFSEFYRVQESLR